MPQAQGFCKTCVFLGAKYSGPGCDESKFDSVDGLISGQWDNDKRMFYVTNEELKVPDLCPEEKKSLMIFYSIDGRRTYKEGWYWQTIDFRQICCTLNPVVPPPSPRPRPRPRPPFA